MVLVIKTPSPSGSANAKDANYQIIISSEKRKPHPNADAWIHYTGVKNPVADSLSFFQKLNLFHLEWFPLVRNLFHCNGENVLVYLDPRPTWQHGLI